VSAQATILSPHRYPAVAEREVHVYLNVLEMPPTCERIALIHTSGNVDWTNERQMINAAKRRAGKAGANALTLTSLRDPTTGTRVAAEVLGLPAERKGQMVAYRCPPAEGTPVARAGGTRSIVGRIAATR
jgi:hypothetical protein